MVLGGNPGTGPTLNGLAKAHFIRQEVTHPVVRDGAGQGPDLVRQRNDGGLDGREQDACLCVSAHRQVLGQGVGYPRGSCDVGNMNNQTSYHLGAYVSA